MRTAINALILKNRDRLKIHECAFIEANQVLFSDKVRHFCGKNDCGMYGSSWACPPGVGSIEDCRDRLSHFQNAFIFTSLSQLKKKHDVRGWLEARRIHENITEEVVKLFRPAFESIFALSTEGCMVCSDCTYPDKPCRFPERLFPAIEGFGINVIHLAMSCEIKYNNGPNTVTYFSAVFF